MRYLFWGLFCGLTFYAVSAHTYSFRTIFGAVEAWLYGALIGCGVAFATRRTETYALPIRFLVGLPWTIACTALYYAIFSRNIDTGGDAFYGKKGTLLAGAVVASIPAVLLIFHRRYSRASSPPGATD